MADAQVLGFASPAPAMKCEMYGASMLERLGSSSASLDCSWCDLPTASTNSRKRLRPCKGKRIRMQKHIQRQVNSLLDCGSTAFDSISPEDFGAPESVKQNPVTWQLFQKMVDGKVRELRQEAVVGAAKIHTNQMSVFSDLDLDALFLAE